MYTKLRNMTVLLETLTDAVAFDGAEHTEGLNQPTAVFQQSIQIGTGTKLIRKREAIINRLERLK